MGSNYEEGGNTDAPPPPGDGAGPLPHVTDVSLLYKGRLDRGEDGGGEERGGGQGALSYLLCFSVFLATCHSPS